MEATYGEESSGKSSAELMRGSLDLLVLSVLADGPHYGYLLQQRLLDDSGGLVQTQAGTLYPLLHRLEEDKLVQAKWDKAEGRKRKWYSLTAAGRRRLKQRAIEWHRYAECLERMLAAGAFRIARSSVTRHSVVGVIARHRQRRAAEAKRRVEGSCDTICDQAQRGWQ